MAKIDELSQLETRILLKCQTQPISKRDITQLYRKFTKSERDQAVQQLVRKGLLDERKMFKPGVAKTPTFYFITEDGEKWAKGYLANFPDQLT
jgi:coproporphyrinogen III oxidase-like Fe-S oxidoreductase